MRTYVRTNINKFSGDNSTFEKEFHVMQEILRRYDEILMGKASKHSVYEVEKKGKDESLDYFDRSKRMVKDLHKQVDNHYFEL